MSYDTTRDKLMVLIKAFHLANYSSLEVNYPKRMITDVEKTKDPFVTIELPMKRKAQGIIARHCVSVEGILIFNHFAVKNSGSKVFNDYSDALFDYFGLQTLSSITFYEVQQYDNSGIPGFDGIMNTVNFDIDYFNV